MKARYLFPRRISCRLVFLLKTRAATSEETRLPRLCREDAQPLLLYDDYRAGVMSLPTM
jgi:hypothetical protein